MSELLEFAKWMYTQSLGEISLHALEAEANPELEKLRVDYDNVALANVGLAKAYQRNLEELETLRSVADEQEERLLNQSKAARELKAAVGDEDDLDTARIVIRNWKGAYEQARVREEALIKELDSARSDLNSWQSFLEGHAAALRAAEATSRDNGRKAAGGTVEQTAYYDAADAFQSLLEDVQEHLPELP